MGLVTLAAVLTAALFICFKVFELWRIPLLPAVTVNYATAFLVGLVLSRPWALQGLSMLWLPAALQGALFIGLFNLMGAASQRIGVAPTTVASKMSLALTVLATVVLFHERPGAWTWAGIVLAVAGVSLSGWRSGPAVQGSWWMVPVLFLANACSDVLLNTSQRIFVTTPNEGAFTTFIFGAAALAGIGWLILRDERAALQHPRTLAAGAVMGAINYGSVYFMVRALSSSGLAASSVFPLVNVGTILFGTAASMACFRERLSRVQWLGVSLSMAALGCFIAYSA